jgi:hypothetical protein
MVGWLAYESGCVNLSEVGRYVNREVGRISSAVRRLSERLKDRPEVADRVKTLRPRKDFENFALKTELTTVIPGLIRNPWLVQAIDSGSSPE